MSKSISAAFIQQFDADVKHAYQGDGGGIRPTIRTKTGVVGNQYKFPTMGKGLATPRGSTQTDVTPMNISHAKPSATLADWVAPEYTDVFDDQKTNVDERQNLAFVIASAIRRREDQIILDAWDAATITNTVSDDIGGTNTNLNTAKCRKAKQLLDKLGVAKGDRYALVHANNLYGLLGDSDATTIDKNTIKMLVDGEVTRWLGFTFDVMEDRDEGGLPIASSIRTTYFYHGGMRGATGLAIGIDFRTEVNYVPEKTSWLSNGLFAAGAVAIDVNGLVEVSCNETGI